MSDSARVLRVSRNWTRDRGRLNRMLLWTHAHSNVDGFVHNCIGHPLLWLAIKLEHRKSR